jgi:peptide/nickel transport system substrate-binding protein
MLKKIKLTYLWLWLALWVILTACNANTSVQLTPTPATVAVEPAPSPITPAVVYQNDNTLRLLYWQAPTTLNPHLSSASQDWAASRITFEPLASYDKDGNLVPFLAAEIPSLDNGGLATDGKSVTWKLKPGVKWSDGEPFTADDVLFTYQFVSNPEVGAKSKATYETVAKVEVIDDYTVKVIFKDVNPAWSLPFVGPTGMILPRHVYEAANGPEAATVSATVLPVGTGPYQVLPPGIKPQEVLFLGSDLVDTNKIVYKPNPFFREEGKPYFSRVEFRGGGTVKEAARLALQTGEADFAWNLQVDSTILSQLEEAGRGQAIPILGSFVERIYFNFTDPSQTADSGERASLEFDHPFFNDIKIRQAFSYAIDREAIAALYGKAGNPSSNILVSPANYNSPNTRYEFNLDKAAALLDEAGWRDTDGDRIRDKNRRVMRVLFQTSANSLRQQTQKIIQKSLQDLGVEVELKVIDSSTFFDSDPTNPNTAYHFYADLQMYNDGNPSPDPGSYMQYLTSDQIPQKDNNWTGENVGRWRNPDYDALYQQSTTEIDPDQRAQLFIQMNDLVINNFAVIPLVHRARVNGISTSLTGIDPTPWDAELWNIKDWRRVTP